MLFQGPFFQSRTHRFTYFPFKRPAKAQHSVRISLLFLVFVLCIYLTNSPIGSSVYLLDVASLVASLMKLVISKIYPSCKKLL